MFHMEISFNGSERNDRLEITNCSENCYFISLLCTKTVDTVIRPKLSVIGWLIKACKKRHTHPKENSISYSVTFPNSAQFLLKTQILSTELSLLLEAEFMLAFEPSCFCGVFRPHLRRRTKRLHTIRTS